MKYVVITHCPHTSPHFNRAVSELMRGTYIECEAYVDEHPGTYIWLCSLYDTREG